MGLYILAPLKVFHDSRGTSNEVVPFCHGLVGKFGQVFSTAENLGVQQGSVGIVPRLGDAKFLIGDTSTQIVVFFHLPWFVFWGGRYFWNRKQ